MKFISSIVRMVVVLPLFVSCSLGDDSLLSVSYTYVNDTPWDITIEAYSDNNNDVIHTLNHGDAVLTLTYYSSSEFEPPFRGKFNGDSLVIKTNNHIVVQEVKEDKKRDDLYDQESYAHQEMDDDNAQAFVYIFNEEFFQ